MSPQDLSPAYYPSAAANGTHTQALAPARPRQRYWLHGLLFVLTIATTTIARADRTDGIFDYHMRGRAIDVTLNHLGRAVFPPIETLSAP